MAPPRFKPTDEQRKQVESMCAYGIPEHAIAELIGIDDKTLRKYFRHELDTATHRANSAVAQSLYQKALGNGPQAVAACIFWLRTRARWREHDRVDVPFIPLGKKEQATEAARTAGVGSEWASDLEFTVEKLN